MATPILDAHCDTILKIVDDGADIIAPYPGTHIDVPRLKKGGVACQIFACFASRDEHGAKVVDRSRELLTAARALVGQGPFVAPTSAAELRALADQDEAVGLLLAVEGGEAVGDDPAEVAKLASLGVRYITLAWGDNQLTGAAFGEGYGLTDLGREVVAEMEQHRLLVDVSHISDLAFADVQRIATRPFIASHSNCRALCDSPRNLTDDQIGAIADSGGVIGVTFVSGFLTQAASDAQRPIYAEYRRLMKDNPQGWREVFRRIDAKVAATELPPLSAIADHVDHMVALAGIDGVAFGSDFDGFAHGPVGLSGCDDYPRILSLLGERGYGEAELRKICWDNWQRVLAETFD
jgi:membrane dipeptidase